MKYYADFYDAGTDEMNTMEFEAEGDNAAEIKAHGIARALHLYLDRVYRMTDGLEVVVWC